VVYDVRCVIVVPSWRTPAVGVTNSIVEHPVCNHRDQRQRGTQMVPGSGPSKKEKTRFLIRRSTSGSLREKHQCGPISAPRRSDRWAWLGRPKLRRRALLELRPLVREAFSNEVLFFLSFALGASRVLRKKANGVIRRSLFFKYVGSAADGVPLYGDVSLGPNFFG